MLKVWNKKSKYFTQDAPQIQKVLNTLKYFCSSEHTITQ